MMKEKSIAESKDSIDSPFEIEIPCIRVQQPLGDFFVASIPAAQLIQVTFSDIRKMTGDREVDTYMGIQREVDKKRVAELKRYVNTVDACFPSSVILAIPEKCAEFDETRNKLILRSSVDKDGKIDINRTEIAKVLDGQHRIEGLKGLTGQVFDMNVSIFIDMDIASQAYLFSIVNLAQTKVKKSLVYDLFEYARARSPQKSAHNIAVALDNLPDSPLYQRIKRLGNATPGRKGETITQSTFVEAILEHISPDPILDRDLYLRGRSPSSPTDVEQRRYVFRELFLKGEDMKIADIVLAYFKAIEQRWPIAWSRQSRGYMLSKSSGFRGLMRLLGSAYSSVKKSSEIPSADAFLKLFSKSSLNDDDFVVTQFLPGSGGEAHLFRTLHDELFGPKNPKLF